MNKDFGYIITLIWAVCAALMVLLGQNIIGFNFALLGVVTLLLTLF